MMRRTKSANPLLSPSSSTPTKTKPTRKTSKFLVRQDPAGLAKRTDADGRRYDSEAECLRYPVLLGRETAGLISDLRRQITFKLIVNDNLVTSYRADYVYTERGRQVVEDIKGMLTPEYKIKRALMLAIHGITIRQVRLRKNKSGLKWFLLIGDKTMEQENFFQT